MDQRRAKAHAYGRWDSGLVDAEPVRIHLLKLGEYGIGYKRVAQLSGLGITPVRNIIWGRQDPGTRNGEIPKRVKRETAEKILAVQPTLGNLGAPQPVKAAPYVRRLQALVAYGWSQAKIAQLLGIAPSNFRYLSEYENAGSHRNRIVMGAGTARAIIALYEQLSVTPPPETEWRDKIAATRARNYAQQRRWPLPMDWEAYDNNFETSYRAPKRSAA